MEVTLYSMNCPKCKVLEEKLTEKGVGFSICTDVAEMKKNAFKAFFFIVQKYTIG